MDQAESYEYAETQIDECIAAARVPHQRIILAFDIITTPAQITSVRARKWGQYILDYCDQHYSKLSVRVVGITDDDHRRLCRDMLITRQPSATEIDGIHLIEMESLSRWYNEETPERGEMIAEGEESILAQSFIEGILKQAKQNLKNDGALAPFLFLHFKDGERGIMPLDLPETHVGRQLYFAAIGFAFLSEGKMLEETVFLSETWYVEGDEKRRLSFDVAPSQHPQRREAITIVGRDAPRTRYTIVIQPFGRDSHQQPMFQPLAVAEYNTFGTLTSGPVGLVDHLFPKRSRLLH